MRKTLVSSSTIVIDANIAVWAVLPIMASVDPMPFIVQWRQQGIRLVAPAHWWAETLSTVRMAVFTKKITAAQGETAIDSLLALRVEIIATDEALCRATLKWAARLNQARAYDGCYMALAESLGAELWTADQRLANRAHQINAPWVKYIGEAG
jgi:predicted nucleic acid-binding protein